MGNETEHMGNETENMGNIEWNTMRIGATVSIRDYYEIYICMYFCHCAIP